MQQHNVLILDNVGNIIGNTSFQSTTLPTVVITTDGHTRTFQRTEDKNNLPAYLEVSYAFSALPRRPLMRNPSQRNLKILRMQW